MNKRIIAVAKKLALAKAGTFLLNNSIRTICEEVGVGQIFGKKVNLNAQDLLAIEKYFSLQLQQPLLRLDLKKEHRLDAALEGYDEKWAMFAVFSDLLNFASQGDPLPLKDKNVCIPKNCVLSTGLKYLDLTRCKRLIVVENGEVLQHLDLLDEILPDEFKQSLVVYRGSASNHRALISLISNLNTEIKLGLFCDYDAAGLGIAQSLNRHFKARANILVPKNRNEKLKSFSKEQCYTDQLHILEGLLAKESIAYNIRNLALDLHKFNLAVMQEHMLANKITLQAYEI